MKKLFMLLFLLLPNYLISDEGSQDSIYERVGNLVLDSEDYIVKPVIAIGQNIKDERKNEEKLKDCLKPLDEIHKKQLIFNLFAQNGNLKNLQKKVFEPYVLHELSVICGSELSKKSNLYRHLDKTYTFYGSAVLARMIAEPTTDVNVLKKRQALIKLFAEDKKLAQNLERALKKLKKYEDRLLNFWNPVTELDPELQKRVFYPKDLGLNKLNKSPETLQNGRRMQLFGVGLNCVLVPVAMVAIPISWGYGIEKASKGPYYGGRNPGAFATGVGLGLLYDLFIAYGFKKVMDEFKLYNHICYTIHKKMKGVAKSLKAIEDIYNTFYDKKGISVLKTYDYIYKTSVTPDDISSEFAYLKELLEENLFHKKPTWSSHMGKILTSYDYMRDIKDQFIGVLEAVGEVDAYLSIAKVINEFKDKRVKYCYVDFVNQDKPHIELEEVWNPLIDPELVVTENIAFGKPEHAHNILLTGPHGGGKSTFMKSVAYSIILGQTFGIAAAKKAKVTPFDRINSYVNIKEDLAAGQSTFMAEKKRVDEIKQLLLNLKSEEKSFTIMDEVFKGTMEDEGARRLYNFGKDIANVEQNICVIATHFNKPAELESEMNGEFTNYHVGLIEQSDKTFVRTFKIIIGKNEWWFNDPAKRERYIDWLTSII